MKKDPESKTILARGVGRWSGRETMPPAPWAPEGTTSTATFDARLVLDGAGLASDYAQSVEGGGGSRSHTLIRWHDGSGAFVMEFSAVDSAEPAVLRGRRSGDCIVFEGPGPGGPPMRQTMTWTADRLRVTSESPDGDGGWTVVFEGEYEPE